MSRFDVTIAGEINLDLILYGFGEQMPVERELLADDFQLTLGSSSAIFAHNLSSLGGKVGFITRVGADPLGEIALDRLRASGVDVSRTTRATSGTQTGITIVLPHGRTRHVLTYPGAMAEMTIADLDYEFLANSDHFHMSSIYLLKGLQADLPGLCRRLKSDGLTLSLDTNDDPDDTWGAPLDELLDLVDILLPNEDEALRIARCDNLDDAITKLAKRVPIVAVKCGARGSVVQNREGRWEVPPVPVTPVDTIGAGDSFDAGFLKGYLEAKPVARCAAMGNATAALSTLRPGGTEAYRDAELMRSFLLQNLTAV